MYNIQNPVNHNHFCPIPMTSGLKGNSYEEKLHEVGMTSLEEKKNRGRNTNMENPNWTGRCA